MTTNDDRRVQIPKDFTLGDLWAATPARIIVYAVIFCTGIFGSGVWVGERGWITDRKTSETTKKRRISSSAEIRPSSSNKNGSKSTPGQNTVEPQLARIRKNNGVKLIRGVQNGLVLERIPNGRFGYTYGRFISEFITRSNQPEIFFEDNFTMFEIHKTVSGKIVLIVYMNKTDLNFFEDSGSQRIHFECFNKPKKNTTLVALDIQRISKFSTRDLPNHQGKIAEIIIRRTAATPTK